MSNEEVVLVGGVEEEQVGSSTVTWLVIWECIESTLNFSVLKFSPFYHPYINNTFASLMYGLLFQTILFAIHHTLTVIPKYTAPVPLFAVLLLLFFMLPLNIAITIIFIPPLHLVPHSPSPFHIHAANKFEGCVRVYISYAVFLAVAGALGSLSLVSLYGGPHRIYIGFVMGCIYALDYLYHAKWIIHFPIIQCDPFFRIKMGIPIAALRALQLSVVTYVFSAVSALFISDESKVRATTEQFIFEQITFFMGIFMVLVCWELNHHLHQVLHTRRIVFASPKQSAAAETNPSEHLLAALEESRPRSLRRYLAYLDLCMVCESNGDTWRRAAFFEETGETHYRVMTACLEPLEKLTWELGEVLESKNSAEKSFQLDNEPTHLQSESRINGAFYDFQLYAWCARIAASLTVHSLKEDHLEVARNCGSYAAAMSALLSCLLALEAFMGKKANLLSPQLTDPANIKWDTRISRRREVAASGVIVQSNPLYSKAYSMADILRTSIYCIVTAFRNEMMNSDKFRFVDEVWVTNKPLFGTREILLQKLRLFLEYREN